MGIVGGPGGNPEGLRPVWSNLTMSMRPVAMMATVAAPDNAMLYVRV